jgi:hypothetical protein
MKPDSTTREVVVSRSVVNVRVADGGIVWVTMTKSGGKSARDRR